MKLKNYLPMVKKENKLTTTKGIKRSLFYIFLQSFIILISPL